MVAASKLPIDTSASALDMAQLIFGDGVTIQNASYSGDANSSGIFSNGNTISPGVTPADSGVIFSTGNASDFTNSPAPAWQWWNNSEANQNTGTSTNTAGIDNDSMFNGAAGANTYDASFLDVDFTPTGDTLTMKFVFASEEFPEYETGIYQDFVGVWVNGQQIPLSVGDGDADPTTSTPATTPTSTTITPQASSTPRWTASPSP